MKILKYEDENYEILLQKHLFIKDKKTSEYYRNNITSVNLNILKNFSLYNEKVSQFNFHIYLLFIILMVISNYFYVLDLQKTIRPNFSENTLLIIIIYFVLNIIAHEFGHIISLRFFGKRIDKVGVKLNFYVFPAVYVQMNETYMLSKRDKIIVHSFGLFINYTFINIIQLINVYTINSFSLTLAYMFFSSTMIWNLIPILNSDGYKVMLATLSLDEYSNFTKNHWLVLMVQIIGVIIALNTLMHWVIYWSKYLF